MSDIVLVSPAETPPENEIWDVFLSYNSVDRNAVLQIKQLLQENGINAFLDRHELAPGTNWFDALERAIGNVRAVAVFVGADGFGIWQKREMHLALDRQAKDERQGKVFPVVPIVLPQANIEKASGFLLLNTWVDFRDGLNSETALASLTHAIRGMPRTPSAPAQTLCPYRALRAFREEDEALFFGREVFTKELLNKILECPVVALVGPSGSGKSSLVQAGLLPFLRRQSPTTALWDAVFITPDERPFHKLAAALVPIWETELSETDRLIEAEKLGNELAASRVSVAAAINQALRKSQGSDRLLLVVDQFEELFRQTPGVVASNFIASLLKAASSKPVTILLTLRADFYGQAISADRLLSDALQRGLVNLGPMNKEELTRSIVNPARLVGLEFERGLVSRILDDVQEQPGNLPLLEFALTELWERRHGHLLTNAAYEEIGKAAGALANRAEAQFRKLALTQQKTLLRVLTRLIRFAAADEEGRDTRRRIKLSLFSDYERSTLAEFVDVRLLVSGRDEITGEEMVELAHESLIHLWPRLGELLDKDREFLLWRQRIDLRLNDWLQKERDNELLLGNVLLKEARRIAKERGEDLNALEYEYIRESEAAVRRPRRWVAAAVAVTAALLLVYGGWHLYTRTDFYQMRSVLSEGQQLATSKQGSKGEWGRTLVLSDRVDEGLALTKNLESPSEKVSVLTPIADALARIGRMDDARRVAFEAFASAALLDNDNEVSPEHGETPLQEISKLLAKRWQVDDIVSAARQIEKPDAKVRVLMAVAEALVENGKKTEASQIIAELLPAARQETDASTLSSRLAKAAELLAGSNETEAKKLADESLAAARRIEGRSEKASAIGTVAEALFKVGDIEKGKDATEEALSLIRDSKDLSYQSMTMMGFSEAIVRAGKADEVMDVLMGIENPMSGAMTIPQLVAVMAEDGMSDQALAATAKFKDETSRYMSYSMIAITLAATGKAQEAITAAQKVSDEQRPFLLAQVAWALAADGKIEPALEIAHSLENTEARPMALTAISIAMAKSRKTSDAIAALKAVEVPELKITVFMLLLDELLKYESPEVIRSVIADGQTTASSLVSSDMRCGMLMMLANAQAKLGDYREARQTIEPCAMPDMKLEIYSTIILEYTKKRYPGQAKVIEEFQKEEEETSEDTENQKLVPHTPVKQ